MKSVFSKSEGGVWLPTELAQGPFAGLQGGAVAGLMVSELEALVAAERLGVIVGIDASYYRATPLEPLRTSIRTLHASRRTAFLESVLCRQDGQACASVRVTVIQPAATAIPVAAGEPPLIRPDPDLIPASARPKAPHGRPWFMDAMRPAMGTDGTAWFRVEVPVVPDAGPVSRVLGPADWCHGIRRPSPLGQAVAADPNPDLSVRLARAPRGAWVGVRAMTNWQETGIGAGYGVLCDIDGDIGSVSMSVALVPAANVKERQASARELDQAHVLPIDPSA